MGVSGWVIGDGGLYFQRWFSDAISTNSDFSLFTYLTFVN